MGKENTRTVKLEKHEPDACVIVGEVKKYFPRIRTVKPKERIKAPTVASGSTTDRYITTGKASGNIKKLCVNLMPVLASAKEPVEEEEEEEEREGCKSCTNEKEAESSSGIDSSVIKLVELPPLTQPSPAPECCDHQKTRVCFTPLLPISLVEQTTVSSNCTAIHYRGDGDNGPWIDHLLSKTRSAEFHLPDITLSSLDTLLQTVTQKLGKKRRGGDEGPWRRVQFDHLLIAVEEQPLREKMVDHDTEERNNDDASVCEASTETAVCRRSPKRQTRLPPLFSAQKPKLILTMTKKTF